MVEGRFQYHGASTIQARMNDDACQIVVHTNFDTVTIKSVHLSVGKDPLYVKISWDKNDEKQYLRVTPEYPLSKNTLIKLSFTFMVNVPKNTESLDGLYSSYYDDADGTRNYLLATQFEAWGARMAFPCFDEPALKATFDMTISYKHYGRYTAMFNTPPKDTTRLEGVTMDTFHRTMKISPYILAIVVAPFTKVSTVSPGGVDVGVIGRDIWKQDAQYALDEAAIIIDRLGEKFGIEYCSAYGENCKSDQIAIPQMRFGAMENWGLVTYREYYLYYVEGRDNFLRKRQSSSIIGHELIHQWFGNLVTCDWWDEIYINEAFGSIGGYLGLSMTGTDAEFQWEDEYLCSQDRC